MVALVAAAKTSLADQVVPEGQFHDQATEDAQAAEQATTDSDRTARAATKDIKTSVVEISSQTHVGEDPNPVRSLHVYCKEVGTVQGANRLPGESFTDCICRKNPVLGVQYGLVPSMDSCCTDFRMSLFGGHGMPWHASIGDKFNCDWFKEKVTGRSRCVKWGHSQYLSFFGKTANEACCACNAFRTD